ncbi:MAG: hypothetical protein HYT79_11055 [Elusimicrobia bacterium]|nr:hypothetical protein [Elusimicrobiota bacterium]
MNKFLLQSALVLLASMTALAQASTHQFDAANILNTHYRTSTMRALGSNQTTYYFSGQEEKPGEEAGALENIFMDGYGKFYMLLTPQGGRPNAIDTVSIYRPARSMSGPVYELGGSRYEVKYVPRNIVQNKFMGDLYLTPETRGLQSHTIPIEDLLGGLYDTARALGSHPFKIAYFSKIGQRGRWVYLMNNVRPENYQAFRRFHVDAADIPENGGADPDQKKSVTFERYRFDLAFITVNGRLMLWVRVTPP